MSARYELIDAEKDTRNPDGVRTYAVVKMCEWLEVSTSGYYEWRDRPPSATAARREHLRHLVADIFAEFDETYGYRRVHAELANAGMSLQALMAVLGHVTPEIRVPQRFRTVDLISSTPE